MKFIDKIVEVKNLTYKNYILNVNFSINRGDYTAIIGPNGGGKSTLVRLLLGLIQPDKGVIKLFGKELKRSFSPRIGYIPQRASLIDDSFPISAREVVMLGFASKKSFFRKIPNEDLAKFELIVEKLGISKLLGSRVNELSGGQRQRVMIARALVSNPDILILDEPNTGVDKASQKRFYELLRDLNKNENITILFVTHDLGVMADDVSGVLCINQSLLSCHNPHEILSCSQMSKLYGIDAHMVCHHH